MTKLEELEAKRHRLKTSRVPNCGIGGPNLYESRRKDIQLLTMEIMEAKLDLVLEKLKPREPVKLDGSIDPPPEVSVFGEKE